MKFFILLCFMLVSIKHSEERINTGRPHTTKHIFRRPSQVGQNIVDSRKETVPSPMHGDCIFYNPADVSFIYDSANNDTLVLAQVVFRHSLRAPVQFYKTDPFGPRKASLWPNGQEMLTEEGKQLAAQFGRYLHFRYPLFNQTYTGKQVFSQSTDVPRVFGTEEIVLVHAFSSNSTPFIINQIKRTYDNKLQLPTMRAPCPNYLTNYNAYLSKTIAPLYVKSKPLFDTLSNLTGQPIRKFDDVYLFSDTIWTECQRGLTNQMPAWVKTYYPNQTQVFQDLYFTAFTATPNLARLTVGVLLTEMIQSFKVAIGSADSWGAMVQDNTPYAFSMQKSQFYMYAAHDITLGAILNSFGMYDNQIKPIAPLCTSAFFLELHCRDKKMCNRKPKDERNYVIKAFYKQRKDVPAIHLKFKKCNDGDFTLAEFQKQYANLLFTDGQTWTEECNAATAA